MTDKEKIIRDYIDYLRMTASLDDEFLKDIVNKAIEKDPEQLNAIKDILYCKRKIRLTTMTCVSTKDEKDEQDKKGEKYEQDDEWKDEDGTKIDIYVDNGCLSVDELKKLAQCIREIEQNNPQRVIKILIDTPEKTVSEMKGVLDSIEPNFPYKLVVELPRTHKM